MRRFGGWLAQDLALSVQCACTGLVAPGAAYASYRHGREFALRFGADTVTASIWPLLVAGLLTIATVELWKIHRGGGGSGRWVAWLAFVFGICLSLVANIGSAPALSVLRVTVAACPPPRRTVASRRSMGTAATHRHGGQPGAAEATSGSGRPHGACGRAVAMGPGEDGFEITREVRRRLETALPRMKLDAMLSLLSSRRGGAVAVPAWTRPTGANVHQSGRVARYESVLTALRDEVAAGASVRVILPEGRERIVWIFAEFQVNLETWRAALTSATRAADFRITAAEIVELWHAAWEAATAIVPGALVDDPAAVPLMAPPKVELQVKSDDPAEYRHGELLHLATLSGLADLSAFGASTDMSIQEGALTVIAPIGLDDESRRKLVIEALTRLAREWGYIDADESDLGSVK